MRLSCHVLKQSSQSHPRRASDSSNALPPAIRPCGDWLRTGLFMVRVASRAAQGRLLSVWVGCASLLSTCGGPLTPPEGVLGPLLRPSWRLQSAAPLWSALLHTPAAMRWFNISSLWPMPWPACPATIR